MNQRVLVTGAGGFLGGAVARLLVEHGYRVRHLSRRRYPALDTLGIEQATGSLENPLAVRRAVAGCDAVCHVAAKAGIWGNLGDYWRPNVLGTRHVLSACRAEGIPRLVVTSSPSVVFHHGDQQGIDESTPYPNHYESLYSRTKAVAEREALAANSPTLAVCALRPHLIWGPGDPHLLPRLAARARAGRLRRVGPGGLVDTTCVENAAHAHLVALQRLAPGAPCAGKAYFIANGQPTNLWELVNRLLAAVGEQPVTKTISPKLAYALGVAAELAWSCLRLPGEPPMTRFVARELATAHWFNLAAAQTDLGYHPILPLDTAIARLARWHTEGGKMPSAN